LALSSETDPSIEGLGFSGEIDIAVEEEFRAFLALAVDQEQPTVDLAAVSFMDSCGLRQILQAAAQAAQQGKVLEIRNPSTPVRHLFELALPEEVPGLRIHDS
jgi:stage II sporulation protein AA (anti-sigma F factor antagonist)